MKYKTINHQLTLQNEIVLTNNYYSFGLKHKGYNTYVSPNGNSTAQEFKFNGIEYEDNTGLYEMDLRAYDPAIARWTGIDPVTHHSMSTYTAFDNNPVYWADPSGADAWTSLGDGTYKNLKTGEETKDWQRAVGETEGKTNDSDDSKSSEDCCGEYVGSYKHKMGLKERNYYRNNKDKKKVVNKAAYEAGILATKVSGDLGGDNLGYSGAIRHSYWMYLVAVELGPELAEKLGILHEDYVVTAGKSEGMHNMQTDDSKMDIINNAWGVNLARQNPNLDYLGFEELFFKDATNKNNKDS